MSDTPDDPEIPTRKFNLKPKSFEQVNGPSAEPSEQPTDVYAILEQNKRHAQRVELPVDLTPRRSRRRRDYWLTMLVGNAVIVLTVAALPRNPMVLACGFSGLVLFSLGVTWVMWVVMDNY
jgi:hypothetical protein